MFYEAIIRVYTKALRKAFDEPDRYRVEEEIARLFRSNTFNRYQREHEVERKEEKYPILKESIYQKKTDELKDWMGKKISLPK